MTKEKYIQNCCTGCGLCHSDHGTQFIKDKRGYFVPQNINNAGYYENICPAFYYMKKNVKFSVWGEYKNVYAGFSTNPQIRYRASSGGALTAISIYLLETGLVDGIIHTGASAVNPMQTETFVSRNRDDVLQHMGSRYGISSPLMELGSALKTGEKYAFIGKPCDVAALKRYREKNDRVDEQIIITLSFFCAGMPSNTANAELLKAMGTSAEKVQFFQYRGNGWPGYATAADNDGTVHQIDYQTAWGTYLGRDVKKICRYCMDGIGEFADIACADLWYLDKNHKPDFSEHEGRNVIFCRNQLGENIFKNAVKEGYLTANIFTDQMDHFDNYQPYQFSRRVTMKYRLLALRLFGRFAPRYDKKFLGDANQYATKRMNWEIFVGTVKRVVKGRL